MNSPTFPSVDKILIVDADEHDAFTLSSQLELGGFANRIAEDAKQGFEKYKSYSPGVTIIDANLPAKSWIQLIQTIRQYEQEIDPDYRSVILVSAIKYTQELHKNALQAGAHDVLGKPIDKDLLIKKIRERTNVY